MDLPQASEPKELIERKQALIAEIKRLSMAPGMAPEEFFPNFYKMVAEIMSAQGGSLWLYESNADRLMCRVDGSPPEGQGPRGPDIETVGKTIGNALKSDNSIVVQPDQADSELARALGKDAGIDALAAVCVPFEIDADNSGAIFLYSDSNLRRFDGTDVFLLKSLASYLKAYCLGWKCRQLAGRAERLDSLVKLSGEISTTLNPEEICFAIANLSADVARADRCFVALMRRGRPEINAISGQDMVQRRSSLVKMLTEICKGIARTGEVQLFTKERLDEIEDERMRNILERYFETASMSAIVGVPLQDDGKPIGVLCFERKEGVPFDGTDMSVIQNISNHSLIVLKNAIKYQRLPMVRTLERVGQWKESLQKQSKLKLAFKAALVVGLIAVLFVPWSFRIPAEAQVASEVYGAVYTTIDGLISKVNADTNDRVEKGKLLFVVQNQADIRNYEIQDAEARGAEQKARMAKTVAERLYWQEEAKKFRANRDYYADRIERGSIKAPVSGTVVTPELKQRLLNTPVTGGTRLCEIVDLAKMELWLYVDESDISFIKKGQEVKFIRPETEEIRSAVAEISTASTPREKQNVFRVTAKLGQAKGLLPNMTGQAYIYIDQQPVWYILFRRVINFVKTRILF
ncbi:MAG: HlyD family efflux transporter periplasmic adaptor subunit [Planctomycetes bacterium]|nr:HlyD family efflux transporter periplasmic adaptor subunit [Planctomycetota bacterium]